MHGKRKVFGKNYTNSPNIQEVIRKRCKSFRKRARPTNNAALDARHPWVPWCNEEAELLGLLALQENLARYKVVDHDQRGSANLGDIGLEAQTGVEGQHDAVVECQANNG